KIKASPVAGQRRVSAEMDVLRLRALRQDFAAAIDCDGHAGGNVNGGPRQNRQGNAVWHSDVPTDRVRTTRRRPNRTSRERAGNAGAPAGVVPDVKGGSGELDIIRVERLYQYVVHARIERES